MNKKKVQIFHSFEEEAKAEYERLAAMTPFERWAEMAVLQERCWGEKWTKEPMKKILVIDRLGED